MGESEEPFKTWGKFYSMNTWQGARGGLPTKMRKRWHHQHTYMLINLAPLLGLSSSKSCCMKGWKAAGALISPNGMTSNSYNSWWVMKAVFSCASGAIWICQYPAAKSKVEKKWSFPNWSNRLSIQGRGRCLFCHRVQLSVVYTKPHSSILFSTLERWG